MDAVILHYRGRRAKITVIPVTPPSLPGGPDMVATDVIDTDQSTNMPAFHPKDLMAAAFAHPIVRLEVRETHISWVVLTGPFAYKIKKSVRFDFLDASTLERRHELCEEELRLNRRLAGDLYVDVVPITREAGGLRISGQGQVLDYAVRMKQFNVTQELPELLARGAVSRAEITDLALRLADFHCCLRGTTQVLSVIPSYMPAKTSGRL